MRRAGGRGKAEEVGGWRKEERVRRAGGRGKCEEVVGKREG